MHEKHYFCRIINEYSHMNKKNVFLLYIVAGLLALLPHNVFSQISGITFDKLTHDYGTINEDSDLRICVFRFINHQKSPVAISHVQSSCGCAVPQYTKKAIPAGGSGEIRIAYNPQGRPGRFNRSIIVSFSGQKEKIHLYVKGTVTPGVERKNKAYPYVIGDLQLRTNSLKLKPMQVAQQRSIMVINSGNAPLRTVFNSANPSVSANMVPAILQPNQKGEIQIIYKEAKNDGHPICLRIKENARHQKKAGTLHLTIDEENCNQ